MIKLVALDMDGTVFADDKSIPEENIRAVRDAMERGVKIVLCSGRDYASLKRELKILGLDHEGQYGVGLNGGAIFRADNGENLYTERMGAEEARIMISAARKYPDMVSIHVFGPDHCYVEVTNETTYYYELVTGSKLTLIEDLTSIAEEAIKVGVFLRSETAVRRGASLDEIMALKEILNKEKPEQIKGEISAPYLVEYVHERMNKSTGLEHLCSMLGIRQDEVMAVGDLENDLAMIRWAGIGCAMKNGADEVKAQADFVTTRTNNEAGVAEVLDLFAK